MKERTAIADAMGRAGYDLAEARLRVIAQEALEKHKGNVERAKLIATKTTLSDPLVEGIIAHLFLQFWHDEKGGQSMRETPKMDAAPHRNGAGSRQDHIEPVARPIREPSAVTRAAMTRVVAITIFDTFKTADGRSIGKVRIGELDGLRRGDAQRASVYLQILKHAPNAPSAAAVSEIINERTLQRFIQLAAEVADAF